MTTLDTPILCLVIIAEYFFLGLICFWCGNFLTTFYFRIPKNIPLNGRTSPPMCSNCSTRIKYPDYGPFYHHLFKGRNCKHCRAIIPPEYFWIEFGTGLALLTHFGINSFSQKTVAESIVLLNLILAFLLYAKNLKFYEKSNWFLTLSAMVLFFLLNPNPESGLFLLCMKTAIMATLIYLFENFIYLKRTKEKFTILEICFFLAASIPYPPEIACITTLTALFFFIFKSPKLRSFGVLSQSILLLFTSKFIFPV